MMKMHTSHYKLFMRLYACALLAACGGLFYVLRDAQGSQGAIGEAVVPAIFFAVCLQSATVMLWKLKERGYEKVYDDPTSIVAMGSVVVFYELGAVGMAMACFFVACINFHDVRNKEFTEVVIKDTTGVLSMGSALLSLYVLDFSISESLPIFMAKLICAAITAGIAHKIITACTQYVSGVGIPHQNEQFASAFTRLLPLALSSGLIGKLYFQFDQSMLWAFAIPVVLYFFLTISFIELNAARTTAVATLVKALEAKDPYTALHADRVAKFSGYIGEEFHFSERRQERLKYAALLHDIGKLIIPNSILNKPGPLNREEYKIILRHEIVTEELLKRIEFLSGVAHYAGANHTSMESMRTHHIESHIIAVCDAFDAMTSSRSYRRALSQEVAFAELREMQGTQFHPMVVDALISAIETRGERYGAGYEVDTLFLDAPHTGVGSAGLSHYDALLVRKRLEEEERIKNIH